MEETARAQLFLIYVNYVIVHEVMRDSAYTRGTLVFERGEVLKLKRDKCT